MALIHSSQNVFHKDLEDQYEFYCSHIVGGREIKKFLEARLLLSNATTAKSTSLPQADISHLEKSLLEAMHELRESAIRCQILNIAVQRSIQSVILYRTPKNLFQENDDCNFIEALVGQQMKIILENSNILRSLDEKLSTQSSELQSANHKLQGRMKLQQERMALIGDITVNEARDEKLKKALLKINHINKLSTLLTALVTQHCHNLDKETKIKLFNLCLKWRKPRSLLYYKNKLSGDF